MRPTVKYVGVGGILGQWEGRNWENLFHVGPRQWFYTKYVGAKASQHCGIYSCIRKKAFLSSEERLFAALQDHFGFSSCFMYSLCSVLPLSLGSWLGPRNKMICEWWSNLWFNSCPGRTVDLSSWWSAEFSCKYLKVFAEASSNFPGWLFSKAFLYLSCFQIKCQLMNCNNSVSLQIYFSSPVLIQKRKNWKKIRHSVGNFSRGNFLW